MKALKLWFHSGELWETMFTHPLLTDTRYATRGKSSGAIQTDATFQWTSAVRGLAVLLVRSAVTGGYYVLQGEGGSIAASLDYAVSKQPAWLTDMLGMDSLGRPLARRLITRTNTERKHPGPVLLALNQHFLHSSQVKIYCDGKMLDAVTLRDFAENLSVDAATPPARSERARLTLESGTLPCASIQCAPDRPQVSQQRGCEGNQ